MAALRTIVVVKGSESDVLEICNQPFGSGAVIVHGAPAASLRKISQLSGCIPPLKSSFRVTAFAEPVIMHTDNNNPNPTKATINLLFSHLP
jgi:hypothetical protein